MGVVEEKWTEAEQLWLMSYMEAKIRTLWSLSSYKFVCIDAKSFPGFAPIRDHACAYQERIYETYSTKEVYKPSYKELVINNAQSYRQINIYQTPCLMNLKCKITPTVGGNSRMQLNGTRSEILKIRFPHPIHTETLVYCRRNIDICCSEDVVIIFQWSKCLCIYGLNTASRLQIKDRP
jgi:hypothetical protein